MAFNPETLRKDFPPLSPRPGKPPIYFDNACMSLRPQKVIDAITTYYLEHPSCHKRAVHAFGRKTSDRFDRARESIRAFVNAESEKEIIFTRNATEGMNILANALPLEKGDVVVTSDLEHNSNTVPWKVLEKTVGIKHKRVSIPPDGSIDLEAFRTEIKGAKIVSLLSRSHVLGIKMPIKEIAAMAHEQGAQMIVDAAQSPLHETLDVRDLGADYLVLSFHKMLGPSGMGMLYGKESLLEQLPQFLTGGETVDDVDEESYVPSPLPYRFEAGLQDYAGAMGAEAAIQYLEEEVGEARGNHEAKLNAIISEGLAGMNRFRLLGPKDPAQRGSIINFYIDGIDSGELSILLDKSENIMTRSGVHCCHAWFRKHGVTPSLRASLAFYNTEREAETFVSTVKNVIDYF
jgi:cysteine desulfurase/selenocysteine lyase